VLTALVLICSAAAAADPGDCTRSNANTVMRVPAEFGNPATCFMHAQAYLAGSSIGQDLDANERVKIVCVRSTSLASQARPR
jgi:hypothetical protein